MYKTICALLMLAFVSSCAGGPGGLGGEDIVATVGGQKITMAQLNEAAKNQLSRVENEVYRIKQGALNQMIDDRLIEQAAKKEGMSAKQYLSKEVDSKISEPTEKEVKAIYDAHKGKDTRPFKELKGQIVQYMKRSQEMQTKGALVSRLRKEADVKILLQPPRVDMSGIIGDAPSKGPGNAKVTIVEFSDYQCPFCKRVVPTVDRIMKNYGDKVRLVFIDNPLSFHRNSPKAHEAAHCAGDQGKYFEFHDKLFDNQAHLSIADLKKYAKELQLDMKKFDKCLDGSKYAARIRENQEKGMRVGVSGTPAFFINGILISGAQPYDAFEEVIETELNR